MPDSSQEPTEILLHTEARVWSEGFFSAESKRNLAGFKGSLKINKAFKVLTVTALKSEDYSTLSHCRTVDHTSSGTQTLKG